MNDLSRTRERVGALELDVSKAKAVAVRESKAHGVTSEEKQNLSVELMEAKLENNRLMVRLQVSERERIRERVEGLSVLVQTSKFNQILQQRIDLHMTSEEPDEEEEASYAEGDVTAPEPTEGTPLEYVPPQLNLLEHVSTTDDRDVPTGLEIEDEVDQCPLEERAQIVDLTVPDASAGQPSVEDAA
ncbi:hypothetical protein U1Q18_021636 [Sarracenia purpurea var. burkii]